MIHKEMCILTYCFTSECYISWLIYSYFSHLMDCNGLEG